jgi:hypothetical protein
MDWESSNLPEAWEKFKRHTELVFKGPLKDKKEEERIAYVLLWIGDKGRDVYQTWQLSDEENKSLEAHYKRFQTYVQPKLNSVFARFRFYNEVQGADSIDKFITRLRLRAQDCKFKDNGIQDEMIRDRLVIGTNNTRIREKLINEGDKLTLDKAIQIAQSFEYCQHQMASMNIVSNQTGATSMTATPVDAIASKRKSGPKRRQATHKQYPQQQQQQHRGQQPCDNCGNNHGPNKQSCPAFGKQCRKCHKLNHFAFKCRQQRSAHKSVHDIDNSVMEGACGHSDSGSGDTLEYFVDVVSAHSSQSPDRAFVQISIGPNMTPVNFKIDTGSECNIIPHDTFRNLKLSSPLEPPDSKLTSYSGDLIKVIGKVRLPCSHLSDKIDALFYVVGNKAPPLLGLKSSLDLKLIKLTYSVENSPKEQTPLTKDTVMSEFKTLFSGVGEIPGYAKLHLKENAVPVVNPPRKVPEALKSRFKAELDRMVFDGIITKVTEPTAWVNSTVLIEKPKTGKLRVCIDPKALNDAICRPHYPMLTLEDVTNDLSGASHFSILDITHAYWSVKLDHESSLLTCFSTPFGRYRYLRLPFGISSSGDIFMQKCNEIFENSPGVHCIVDDILISGRSRAEHDQNLRNALKLAQNKGVRFNPNKCIISATEVPFFGHVVSSQGLKPDSSKQNAITDLKAPKTRAELETFLGMVNYLAKFAPNLAEITAPLRSLLQKEVEFLWDDPQSRAFEKVKAVITNAPVLGYFDPKEPLVLECDASQNGLGCSLWQKGRPIAYASKSLTASEKLYANIERELLAIVFGCKRFHQLTYGRHVTVHSDHKPISSIIKKPLSAAPPRLQRLLLSLQKYDITVEHVRGKDIPVSDYLSRHSVNDTYPTLIDGLDTHVHSVRKQLLVTDRRLEIIRQAIRDDSQMQLLKQTILDGWPESRSNCNPVITEFFNHRDELSYEDDLIFRGQTLLIPRSLQPDMIRQVHIGHLGVTKTLQRAKDCMFWPGMQKQISEHILQCPICLTHRDSNAKEPMITSEFPDRPYQVLSTDLFHFDNRNYLLTVDHYSNFFEIDFLPDTKSYTVIRKLQTHFARNGICDVLHSDNGPQFSSTEFADFAKSWHFTHATSSPLHSQGNCLAERSVGIAKKLMKKARDSNQNIYVVLLEYRNTPLNSGYSPAQLLLNRRTKSVLPITNKALCPQVINARKVKQCSKYTQARSKHNYDKSVKSLPPLNVNDPVRIQMGKIWVPGKVIQKHCPRSYTVQTREGVVYRRNRIALHKTNENVSEISVPDYNILANTPKEPQSAASAKTAQVIPLDNSYATRSGRVVKKNARFYGAEYDNR